MPQKGQLPGSRSRVGETITTRRHFPRFPGNPRIKALYLKSICSARLSSHSSDSHTHTKKTHRVIPSDDVVDDRHPDVVAHFATYDAAGAAAAATVEDHLAPSNYSYAMTFVWVHPVRIPVPPLYVHHHRMTFVVAMRVVAGCIVPAFVVHHAVTMVVAVIVVDLVTGMVAVTGRHVVVVAVMQDMGYVAMVMALDFAMVDPSLD